MYRFTRMQTKMKKQEEKKNSLSRLFVVEGVKGARFAAKFTTKEKVRFPELRSVFCAVRTLIGGFVLRKWGRV